MDPTEFTIGAPHKWRTYIDQGEGTLATLVYPVHIKINKKNSSAKELMSSPAAKRQSHISRD